MNGGSSLHTAGCEQIEHFRKLPRKRRAHKDGIQLSFGSAAQQILGFFEPCGARPLFAQFDPRAAKAVTTRLAEPTGETRVDHESVGHRILPLAFVFFILSLFVSDRSIHSTRETQRPFLIAQPAPRAAYATARLPEPLLERPAGGKVEAPGEEPASVEKVAACDGCRCQYSSGSSAGRIVFLAVQQPGFGHLGYHSAHHWP